MEIASRELCEGADDDSSQPSFVAIATVVAFFAYGLIYAVAGEPAAGISFWGILIGLSFFLTLLSTISQQRRRRRQEEIELAVELALLRIKGQERDNG